MTTRPGSPSWSSSSHTTSGAAVRAANVRFTQRKTSTRDEHRREQRAAQREDAEEDLAVADLAEPEPVGVERDELGEQPQHDEQRRRGRALAAAGSSAERWAVRLRAVAPGGQIRLLLGRQLVDLDVHRGELEPRDLEVDVARHDVHLGSSALCFFTMYSAESAWFAKLMSMTAAGCPSAAARLMSRPSPSTYMRRPPTSELLDERAHGAPRRRRSGRAPRGRSRR